MFEQILQFYRMKINPHCKGEYASYVQAKQHIKSGYEDKELVERVVNQQKLWLENEFSNGQYSFSDLRCLVPLLLTQDKNLYVTDLGGAGGDAYFKVKKFINSIGLEKKLNWHVVETELMVEKARRLENGELDFIDFKSFKKDMNKITTTEVTSCNVLFSSSTVQYLEDPERFLTDIVSAKRYHYIFLSRTPFVENGTKIISIQHSKIGSNGAQVVDAVNSSNKNRVIDYVITFLPLITVKSIFDQNGYDVIMCIKEKEYMTAKNVCGQYYGILAKIK